MAYIDKWICNRRNPFTNTILHREALVGKKIKLANHVFAKISTYIIINRVQDKEKLQLEWNGQSKPRPFLQLHGHKTKVVGAAHRYSAKHKPSRGAWGQIIKN